MAPSNLSERSVTKVGLIPAESKIVSPLNFSEEGSGISSILLRSSSEIGGGGGLINKKYAMPTNINKDKRTILNTLRNFFFLLSIAYFKCTKF